MPEDYGSGASNLAVAAIEPSSSDQLDRWDYAPAGGLLIASRVNIILLIDMKTHNSATKRLNFCSTCPRTLSMGNAWPG